MIVEGQTELLDVIEEARARLALALASGAREAPDLATELGRLERILPASLLGERSIPCPGNGNRPVGVLRRFAGSNGRTQPGQSFLLPGKAGAHHERELEENDG